MAFDSKTLATNSKESQQMYFNFYTLSLMDMGQIHFHSDFMVMET